VVTNAVSRFEGFAAGYDAVRPAPPADLPAFLADWSGRPHPDVADIGAGTGLATMIWAGTARSVTAIEPGSDMRGVLAAKLAAAPAGPTRFTVSGGTAEATGLDAGSVDIVTASTAMHWFDPGRALPEIVRVLRPGGVAAAFGPAWPPRIDAELDAAFGVFDEQMSRLEAEYGLRPPDAGDDHAATMRASGLFRHVASFPMHGREDGDLARLLGLAHSRGGVVALLAAGASAEEIGLTALAEVAARRLTGTRPWWWTFEVSLGVPEVGSCGQATFSL
jgi:SAM-dependent methyltransferase